MGERGRRPESGDRVTEAAKVTALQFGAGQAEDLLRGALAQCAEMRSRGVEPYLIVLLGEDDHLPQLGRTPMLSSEILACAMRVHVEAEDHIREIYSE